MRSDWPSIELRELVEISTAKMETLDIPQGGYVSTDNMVPNFGGVTFNSSIASASKTSRFSKNDILFSNIRTYFRKLWLADREGGCSNDVIVFCAKKHISPKFLFYTLMDERFIQHTIQTSKGTKMPRGDKSAITQYKAILPPLPEQKAIAHILGSLDDKIELNRRMNATLEGMAQALFKSWFVDFDPVIDNALAAGNPIPDELAARAEVRHSALRANAETNSKFITHHSAFPSKFTLTDTMGWIPEGWEETNVGNHVSLQRGTTYKSKLKGLPGPYLLGLGAIQRNGGFKEGKLMTYGGESPAKITIGPGDIFVSLKDLTQAADLLGSVARIPPHIPSGRLTQDTVALVFDKTPISKNYLYNALLTPRYRDYCRNYSTGTTNLGLAREDFFSYPVPKPDDPVQELYDNFVSGNQNRHQVNTAQANSLTTLRDTLLPKLISGEIRALESEQLTKD